MIHSLKTAAHNGRNLRKISEVELQEFPDLYANSRTQAACMEEGSSYKLRDDKVVDEFNDRGGNIESFECSIVQEFRSSRRNYMIYWRIH